MTQDQLGNWIQVAAVVAAVSASIVALRVSAADRRNARRIADEDRRASLKHAKLMFDLEALLRLSQNLDRGGSTDPEKRDDMGAEAWAIIGMIGPDLLPMNWEKRIGKTDGELREFIEDGQNQEFLRRAAEAHKAMSQVTLAIAKALSNEGDAS